MDSKWLSRPSATGFTGSKEAAFYRCEINQKAIVNPYNNRKSPDITEESAPLLYKCKADWELVHNALKGFKDTYEMKREAIEYCILKDKPKIYIPKHEAYNFCEQMNMFFYEWISYHDMCYDDELN